ncbi:MAG: riboflavin synthase [Candidatus Daviesbacteria bacterium]|nr:riboflavin synthase [Candidatus Daviesbacteria bacterium]
MFTGIISHLGKLNKKEGSVFIFDAGRNFCKKIKKGMSIAINGVCLTALNKPIGNYFSVEVMPETLNKTMLGQLKKGNPVNLELPVTPQTYLSGHIVEGHIDGVSKLLDIKLKGNSRILKFSASPFTKYIVPKGSIAINGISLTVIEARKDYFTVGIIPFTWDNTMLKLIKTGDLVNIEVDILAKYLEKLIK